MGFFISLNMEITELYKIFLKHPKTCTDTRADVENSIFFALKGENFDGNQYANSALEKGAAYAVVDNAEYKTSDKVILVEDVLEILQDLARYHRSRFDIPVIAITGSNGKTTTKELITQVLKAKYKTLSTVGNLNNHIGVPLTLLRITSDTEIAVVEMGANHQGEIEKLCRIAEPGYGLITNIGKAHLEGFGGFGGVVKAKTELYHFIRNTNGSIFINNENELLIRHSAGINKIYYGTTPGVNCRASVLSTQPFVKVNWLNREGGLTINSNLYGAYNFENILASVCVGDYFKVNREKIVRAIENYIPDNQRSEIIRTGSNKIFMDAYNANPTSMSLALEEFSRNEDKKKIVILGDMLELGNQSMNEHQNILDQIKDYPFEKVFVVGPYFQKSNTNKKWNSFGDVQACINHLKDDPVARHSILIKGSRGIQLEKLVAYL